jgi:hypothetical protein
MRGMFSSVVMVCPQRGHLLRPLTIVSPLGMRCAATVAKLPNIKPRKAPIPMGSVTSGLQARTSPGRHRPYELAALRA